MISLQRANGPCNRDGASIAARLVTDTAPSMEVRRSSPGFRCQPDGGGRSCKRLGRTATS
jgi:hypothetical protein